MNKSFDPIRFGGQPFDLAYRRTSAENFSGYYHWHQCCELLYVHEGRGVVIVNQQHYELKRGMLFAFQPFELHYLHVQVSPEQPYVRTIIHGDPLHIERILQAFPVRLRQFARLCKGSQRRRAYDIRQEEGGDRVGLCLLCARRGAGKGRDGRRDRPAARAIDGLRRAGGAGGAR
ncbi:AraC family ligand binding domain-containing protein [Cohnella rhizosphaerae]|uniref:AraC family ligand binding domain-containing protein n=1 Tax=Cohnella rhizosphaerae TaxID=1457232 RepID=A0A9X4QU01_9BACL|nr:AraC family ligand binding domain-containing protein [Cohnella rhizosphaerae]MDG0809952.1 AraC family ligand binding domain-containing protein [Cohnella rhizosphaerae]